MEFGKVYISLSAFDHKGKKLFFKALHGGNYRGDYEQAWKSYRAEARKAKKKK